MATLLEEIQEVLGLKERKDRKILEEALKFYKAKTDTLENELLEYKSDVYSDAMDKLREESKISIDYNTVFSIERVDHGKRSEHTCVGLIGTRNEKHIEWSLYISRSCHNKLVKEFDEFSVNVKSNRTRGGKI